MLQLTFPSSALPTADPPQISFAMNYIEIAGTVDVYTVYLQLSKPSNTRFLAQVVHSKYRPTYTQTHTKYTQYILSSDIEQSRTKQVQ